MKIQELAVAVILAFLLCGCCLDQHRGGNVSSDTGDYQYTDDDFKYWQEYCEYVSKSDDDSANNNDLNIVEHLLTTERSN